MDVKLKVNSQLVTGWLMTVAQSSFSFTKLIVLGPEHFHSFPAVLPSFVQDFRGSRLCILQPVTLPEGPRCQESLASHLQPERHH